MEGYAESGGAWCDAAFELSVVGRRSLELRWCREGRWRWRGWERRVAARTPWTG